MAWILGIRSDQSTQALVRQSTETKSKMGAVAPTWMSGGADHRKGPSSSHPQWATEKSDQSTQAFVL
jgi:hypothetical protein